MKLTVRCPQCRKEFDINWLTEREPITYKLCDSCLDKMLQNDRDLQTGVNDPE